MKEMTFEEVRAFDLDANNVMNCGQCPHNQGASDWQGAHPCGQWHCWVYLATKGGDEE